MERAANAPRNKGGRINRSGGPPLPVKKLLVENANKQEDVLSLCTDVKLTRVSKTDKYEIIHETALKASQETKDWVLDLTRENVKELYEASGWGWCDDKKENELTHPKSQYLIIKNSSDVKVAFTHFRFDMDYGNHVLYCYELQVSSSYQSSGFGTWLMKALMNIAQQSKMSRVVLTVGCNNPRALKFYCNLGYKVDETSPINFKTKSEGTYIILSKSCKPKSEK